MEQAYNERINAKNELDVVLALDEVFDGIGIEDGISHIGEADDQGNEVTDAKEREIATLKQLLIQKKARFNSVYGKVRGELDSHGRKWRKKIELLEEKIKAMEDADEKD